MTLSTFDLLLYSGALLVLFLTPGPVWVALLARAMSGGFHAAWPLALGVVIGDVMWSVLALLGVSWVVSVYAGFLTALKIFAAFVFIVMGVLLIRHAGRPLGSDSRLTTPGMMAGFIAGLAVILGNPKAILFYMGVLPGFFDLSRITWLDVAVIALASAIVPLIGNLLLAAFVGKIRAVLTNPETLKRVNLVSGALLILVGLVIPVT